MNLGWKSRIGPIDHAVSGQRNCAGLQGTGQRTQGNLHRRRQRHFATVTSLVLQEGHDVLGFRAISSNNISRHQHFAVCRQGGKKHDELGNIVSGRRHSIQPGDNNLNIGPFSLDKIGNYAKDPIIAR
ncbi:hypothetical protein D3C75_905190 [compost metagenome]